MPSSNLLLTVFVGIAAVALLGQMLVFLGIARKLNQLTERLTPMLPGLEEAAHKLPGLVQDLQAMVNETRPRLDAVTANLVEISGLARTQAQRADAFLEDFAERLGLQVMRVDEALSTALTHVEQTVSTVRRMVLRPVQDASAVLQGVRTGLDFFFRRRSSPAPETAHAAYQDEEMFI